MKLSFRDLKQQKFDIEAEPSETVGQVKEKIQQEKGWEASSLKLIYSGKILQDANTVESYKIEEKGYIVCMIQKPKPQPGASTSKATAAAPSTPGPASTQSQTPAAPVAAPSTQTTEPPATPSPAAQAVPASRRVDDTNTMAIGAENAAAIENMQNMGFERADIDRAMRAAFFNPDRAVEYLLTGIPEHLQREQPASTPSRSTAQPASTPAAAQTSAPTTAPATEGSDEPFNMFEAAAQAARGPARPAGAARPHTPATAGTGATGASGEDPTNALAILRTHPQFQQLRQLIQQQPQMLEQFVTQLGQGNPQIAALINQHPEEFIQLLSDESEDDAVLPPGAQTVHVTEEERDAIDRLCMLGFERDDVIQAYFACDKDEQMAANLLFEAAERDGQ